MVVPILVIGAYAAGAAAITATTAYFAGDSVINQNQTSYISNNTIQNKTNEVFVSSGATIGNLNIRDKLTSSTSATTAQEQTASNSKGLNPLIIAAGAAGAYYILRGKK